MWIDWNDRSGGDAHGNSSKYITDYRAKPWRVFRHAHNRRPPSGEYSERTLAITRDLGYETVFWSMAYLDYDVNKQPGADYVIDYFKKYYHNGAIPLMHNVSSSNAEALDTVLTNLENEGFTFGNLNNLGKINVE